MEGESSAPLHVTPPRRAKRSALRCVGITCLLFVVVVIGLIGYSFFTVLKKMLDDAKSPHKAVLYNGTLDTPGRVVKPLIDLETRYDVAVTIWVRQPDNDTRTEELLEQYRAEHGDDEFVDKAISQIAGVPTKEVQLGGGPETALFAGIVARDLSLTSRSQNVKITFDLPLERFYDDPLFMRDVRMGVGIIPRSPSKFDRMEDWSDWRPQIGHLDRLNDSVLWDVSYPFNDNVDMTNHIDALEAMATSMSLIAFHHIHDPCPSNKTLEPAKDGTDAKDVQSADKEDDFDEDDLYSSIQTLEANETEKTTESGSFTNSGFTEKKLHPHILSRSHFYIMNETRLFDRKAFDQKHKQLMTSSCGQNLKNLKASPWLCRKAYETNGHWETRFGLHPAAPGGKKELAYGPYVFSLNHAAGPKDIHRIPVSRGNCSGIPRDRSEDPKTMRIEHTLRFSSLTPARVQLLEKFQMTPQLGPNMTKGEIIQSHSDWEQMNGLLGSKAEGTHPWRRLLLTFTTEVLLNLSIALLTLVYWHTRTTAAGIDHSGTILLAGFWMLHTIIGVTWAMQELEDTLGRLIAFIFDGYKVFPCYLMLKLVWLLEWIPGTWGVRRSSWTHRERRSMRVEAEVQWPTRLAVILACFALTYIPQYFNFNLLNPHSSSPETQNDRVHWFLKSPLTQACLTSPQLAGVILQLEHNRREGTFAGAYAVVAYMRAAKELLEMLYYLPIVVGRYEVHSGLTVISACWIGVIGYAAWQAVTLPRVEQNAGEAEDE